MHQKPVTCCNILLFFLLAMLLCLGGVDYRQRMLYYEGVPLRILGTLYQWFCHGKRCPAAKRGPGDVTMAFERLLSDSCYTNASIT